MKLTKYQKARLLEYEWDVIENDIDDDTCWLRIDQNDGEVFKTAVRVLNLTPGTKAVKLLFVATQTE